MKLKCTETGNDKFTVGKIYNIKDFHDSDSFHWVIDDNGRKELISARNLTYRYVNGMSGYCLAKQSKFTYYENN